MEVLLEYARRYAALGWYLLPVLGKVPNLGREWQNNTVPDPAILGSSFDGIGVQLGSKSGIVDIECDSEEAEEELSILLRGEVPNTPTFQSTRGRHYIYRWRPGLPDTAKFNLGFIEFRIGNVAAQSVFPPSGGREWIIPPETPVLDFPIWDMVCEAYKANQRKKEFKKPAGTHTSYLHNGANEALDVPKWLAKNKRDIIQREDGDGATRWFIECPGLEKHTNRNAWRDCCVTQEPNGRLGGHCFHTSCGMSDWGALRTAIGELEYSDFHEEPNGEPVDLSGFCVEPPRPEPTPLTLRPQGLIGDIVEYTLRTQRYPQPALAVAGALALMSVITGRKVEDEQGTRTNLFTMGVCPPAGGKDRSRQVNKEILLRAGGEGLIGPESLGSSAGLVSVIEDQPATLFQLDEIGKLFAVMQNTKAGHLYNIGREFLKLYSSAGSLYIGDAYADRKKIKRIYQPHAVLYGTSTPESFWNSLSSDNVSDGLVGRFLVFDAENYTMPTFPPREDIPPSILARVRWWLDYKPAKGDLASTGVHPITVPFGPGARERLQGQELEIARKRIREDSTAAAVWSRTSEKSYKLALLFACSRAECREPGVISFEDADLAVRITNLLTRQMLAKVGDHISDGENESRLKKVLRRIGTEIQRSHFTRATQFLRDSRERGEILKTLVEAGHVRLETRETKGRAAEWIVKLSGFH